MRGVCHGQCPRELSALPCSVQGAEPRSGARRGLVKAAVTSWEGRRANTREQVGAPAPAGAAEQGHTPQGCGVPAPLPCHAKRGAHPQPRQGPLPSGICMENSREGQALPMHSSCWGGTGRGGIRTGGQAGDSAPLSSDTPNLCDPGRDREHPTSAEPRVPDPQGRESPRTSTGRRKGGCFHLLCRSWSLPARGAALGKGMRDLAPAQPEGIDGRDC